MNSTIRKRAANGDHLGRLAAVARTRRSAPKATMRGAARRFGLACAATLWALAPSAAIAASPEPAPRHWDREAAETLLAYIEQIDSHGLDPTDYAPEELRDAIASGDARLLERRATASFADVAADLALGHLRPGTRGRYFIPSDPLDPKVVALLIDSAIADRSVVRHLERLAPQDSAYAALRTTLARLGPEDRDKRRKIEVTLERRRWLPRELGRRHLLVNIPEYRVRLMVDAAEKASHRVIVGKTGTPTPQFTAKANAVVFNPSWHVPRSIVAESVGQLVRKNPDLARARGYVWDWDRSGQLQVVQMPGPQNALGQMKLDMPNAFSVFLHDTPSKDLFVREDRTFSHGCIRTDAPLNLAATLLASEVWTREAIDRVVAAGQTQRVPLPSPVPVYVVYLTAVVNADGSVRYLDDPYKLDAAIATRLNDGR